MTFDIGPLTPIAPALVRAMLQGVMPGGVSAELADVKRETEALAVVGDRAHTETADIGGPESDRLNDWDLIRVSQDTQWIADHASDQDISDIAWHVEQGEGAVAQTQDQLAREDGPNDA